MSNKLNIDLNSECINYTNVSQTLIHITEDKLKVILMEHEKKNSQFYSWTTPLGIFLSIMLATITSEFTETFGVSSNTWQAVFIIGSFVTFLWLVYAIICAIKNRKGRAINDVIRKIKNNESDNG